MSEEKDRGQMSDVGCRKTKVCTKCGKEKEISAFAKHPHTQDGHEGQCKQCRAARAKELRELRSGGGTGQAHGGHDRRLEAAPKEEDLLPTLEWSSIEGKFKEIPHVTPVSINTNAPVNRVESLTIIDDHEPVSTKFEQLAIKVGQLVDKKQAAYGDSFGRSGRVMRELYPDGIRPEQYDDALAVIRIVDKLFRIANDKDAFGESPFQDIAGYGLLGMGKAEIGSQTSDVG